MQMFSWLPSMADGAKGGQAAPADIMSPRPEESWIDELTVSQLTDNPTGGGEVEDVIEDLAGGEGEGAAAPPSPQAPAPAEVRCVQPSSVERAALLAIWGELTGAQDTCPPVPVPTRARIGSCAY